MIDQTDPKARNLGEFLDEVIDCDEVSAAIADMIGLGSSGTYVGACNAGIRLAGTALYLQLANLDSAAFELSLTGTAKGIDRTNDRSLDAILSGGWTGNVIYAGTPLPLTGASFSGARK